MSFEPRDYLRHILAEGGLGMSDRLIHDYFGVDHEIVWGVVQNHIPGLRRQIATTTLEA